VGSRQRLRLALASRGLLPSPISSFQQLQIMTPNPGLGVLLHAIGGFAAGSFYSPLKKIRGWSWESAWLIMGLSAWLAAPWVASYLTTPRLGEVISESFATQSSAIKWAIFFGFLWGFGNLTYGMSARYLGIALGGSVALAFCMVFGTLAPPLHEAYITRNFDTVSTLWSTKSGMAILAGIAMCMVGILLCGLAGRRRETELSTTAAAEGMEEFNFRKGIAVAIVAGLLSACFAFGLDAGKSIAQISVNKGTDSLYQNNVVLIAVLTGGFLSNALGCLFMNLRNRTFGDYGRFDSRYLANLILVTVAGVTWFCQFFFYGMGQSKLGKAYEFSSWSIHMAFIVVFLNLWGLVFHEWRGTSAQTKRLIWIGILILIGSTIAIGVGNKIAAGTAATSSLREAEPVE
jgi:L-rhamnose-H+ transport protein